MFLSFEVDAVEVAGDDDGAGVEKVAAGLFGETAVVFGEPYGLLRGLLEHLRQVGEVAEGGR